MYLLDTNTVIDHMRRRGGVSARLIACDPSEVAVCPHVAYELWRGIAPSAQWEKRRQELQQLLNQLQQLPFSLPAARQAAQVRIALEQRGLPIGPVDTLIAGTAIAHGAILVTRNIEDFSRIPGLHCESWYVP